MRWRKAEEGYHAMHSLCKAIHYKGWKMPKKQPIFIFFLASHTTGPSPCILYSVLVTQ